MKFSWCTITVGNIEESLKFYTEIVGLPIQRRFTTGEGAEIAFLGENETKIELISNSKNEKINEKGGISLGFEVKSIDEMMKFIIEKGLKIDDGPFQPNPHVKFFYVKDPNGLKIQFVENM